MNDLPNPMTPADCDLRDYAWMPLDVRRLLTSETWVLGSPEEKVAAVTLWCEAWQQVPAASLPDNDRMLAHLSMAGAGWKKIREAVMKSWVKCSDGRLYHPVVAEKANEAWAMKQAQRQRTEAARRAKAERTAGKTTSSSGSPVTEPVTEAVAKSSTENVTGSTVPNQTIPNLKERTEASLLTPAEPPSLWREGVDILVRISGKATTQAKPLVGKWRKALNEDEATLYGLICQAAQMDVADPVSWIEKAVRVRTRPPDQREFKNGFLAVIANEGFSQPEPEPVDAVTAFLEGHHARH